MRYRRALAARLAAVLLVADEGACRAEAMGRRRWQLGFSGYRRHGIPKPGEPAAPGLAPILATPMESGETSDPRWQLELELDGDGRPDETRVDHDDLGELGQWKGLHRTGQVRPKT
ncbi:hypothetical protein GQ53DRAFT_770916 [Thozetella sp. PMI_491]|nr:hypothetical protein GQ53DRAFT_770916 [Thozetella sp. PMI_491]